MYGLIFAGTSEVCKKLRKYKKKEFTLNNGCVILIKYESTRIQRLDDSDRFLIRGDKK